LFYELLMILSHHYLVTNHTAKKEKFLVLLASGKHLNKYFY